MSELKELVEKFIELDDDLNAKIEESLDDNDELPESFEAENEAQINEMGEIYHDIEHKVFDEEFIIVFNSNEDEKEVVALIVSDEDEDEEFVIPAFTDEEEANAAIEQFKKEFGDIDFECEIKTGSAIIADHHEDDGFIGLAINAPQWDFVIAHEDVHECCD
ncbi:SseB family protein [Methanobrevibacter sp.]